MQLPQIRTAAISGSQFLTGFIAAAVFFSSNSVDLYAAWADFYQGFKLMLGAWAVAGPILLGGYAVYKSSTSQKLADVMKDPEAPAAAQALPVTPVTVAVADALKKAP